MTEKEILELKEEIIRLRLIIKNSIEDYRDDYPDIAKDILIRGVQETPIHLIPIGEPDNFFK